MKEPVAGNEPLTTGYTCKASAWTTASCVHVGAEETLRTPD